MRPVSIVCTRAAIQHGSDRLFPRKAATAAETDRFNAERNQRSII
jgi:hypothetical protein